MRRQQGGATLVEILVATALMGLVMASVSLLLVSGYRYYARSKGTLEAQRNALLGLARVSREVAEGSPMSLLTSTDPPGLVFAHPRNADGHIEFDNSGDVLWQKTICYYLDDSGPTNELIRKVEPITPPVPYPPELTKTVADFEADATLEARLITRYLKEFTVTPATNALEFRLTGTSEELAERFSVSVQTKVFLRN